MIEIRSARPMVSLWQRISCAVCFVASAYVIVLGVPSLIHHEIAQQQLVQNPQASELEQAEKVELVPFQTDAIEIKASGEDPIEPDADLKAYLATLEGFADRFGNSFDYPWAENLAHVRHDFTVPKELEGMVNFWVQIFGYYQKEQFIFYHADAVEIVYSAIDLSELNPLKSGLTPDEAASLRRQYIKEEQVRIRKRLRQLSAKIKGKQRLDQEEARLAGLFAQYPELSIDKATDKENLSIQQGFAHRIKQAIEISGRYMTEMENIFSMKGVPIEITRLALIESAFNIKAYSSANAAGLWQFIPDTGKRYLKIDEFVDERYDPILATYAAAEHLKHEYELLGRSWPLAINAYNTGPGRIMQAQKQLQTNDIATIIKKFKGAGYKFYSRNYYPEFLAALHVYENQEHYFGAIEQMPALQYDLFSPQHEVSLIELIDSVQVSRQLMTELNPALKPKVLSGQERLPAGYLVRVPKQLGRLFASAAMDHYRIQDETQWHIAKKGESLNSIANQYKVDADGLERMNQFLSNEILPEGTVIELPKAEGVALQPAAQ